MLRGFFAIVGLCVFSFSAFSANKSLKEHWEDVGMDYASVANTLESANCYKSERNFLGCVNAIDTALNQNGWSLVPRSRSNDGFGKALESFGSVEVRESKKAPTSSIADLLQFNRTERKKAHLAWLDLFNHGNRIPMERVTGWLTSQKFFQEEEAVLSATLFNTFLMVTRDPHTMVIPAAYVKQGSTGKGENFTGIGAVFRTVSINGEKWFVVDTPLEGSPALKAGLRSGDRLVKIDGAPVTGKAFRDVVAKIRGKSGSQVVLTVDRQGTEVDVSIVRGKITVANVEARVFQSKGRKMGYLKLRGFMRPSGCSDLETEIRRLELQSVEGLVFDLRGNGGGLLTQSVCVGNLFLARGTAVVTTKTNSFLTPSQTLRTQGRVKTRLPLVTLVDHGSASASEIVSGALQDHQRSLIVGTKTFGKGTVQNQRPLRGGKLVLRETIGRFYLPSGRSNQISGVVPDFEVFDSPNPTADEKVAYREADEYLAYPGQGDPWKQPRPGTIQSLQTCLDSSGTAKSRFSGHQGPMRTDYQRWVAEDVLDCAITLGVPMPIAEAVDFQSLLPLGFGANF